MADDTEILAATEEPEAPDPRQGWLTELAAVRNRARAAHKQLDLHGLADAVHDLADLMHRMLSQH